MFDYLFIFLSCFAKQKGKINQASLDLILKNTCNNYHDFVLFSCTVFVISFTIVLVRYSETKLWNEEEAGGRSRWKNDRKKEEKKNPPIFATILLLSPPTKKNKKGRLQMVARKSTIYRMLKC